MFSDHIIIHGLIYTGGFSLIILISVLINPRIWMQDLPDNLKNDIPPKTDKEIKQTFVTGFVFALFIVGFPLYSLSGIMEKSVTPLSFSQLILHAFSIMMICNVLYWLVFDLLIFNLIISHVRTIPGLKKKLKFSGWRRQVFGMFVGTLSCILISGFSATVASFFL
ncbi:MAG: hypothetical protein JEY91_13200 [Spirochaetaceae bacterium]|nr:hypothetical protein [Spirochaetaceae bacterium]